LLHEGEVYKEYEFEAENSNIVNWKDLKVDQIVQRILKNIDLKQSSTILLYGEKGVGKSALAGTLP